MEGISLRPALAGGTVARSQPLFWEHEGNRAVRSGNWKLVSMYPDEWELYDMAADRVERNDLAARDRKSTRLNSSHSQISYAVFCLKKKKTITNTHLTSTTKQTATS